MYQLIYGILAPEYGSPLEGLPYGDTHPLYPYRIFSVRLPRMKNLTATICLTLAVLLGNVGLSWSADMTKKKMEV
jgi:hypothetical protein